MDGWVGVWMVGWPSNENRVFDEFIRCSLVSDGH